MPGEADDLGFSEKESEIKDVTGWSVIKAKIYTSVVLQSRTSKVDKCSPIRQRNITGPRHKELYFPIRLKCKALLVCTDICFLFFVKLRLNDDIAYELEFFFYFFSYSCNSLVDLTGIEVGFKGYN